MSDGARVLGCTAERRRVLRLRTWLRHDFLSKWRSPHVSPVPMAQHSAPAPSRYAAPALVIEFVAPTRESGKGCGRAGEGYDGGGLGDVRGGEGYDGP